jgi:TolB-like protein
LQQGSERTARWSLRLLGGFELARLPGRQKVTLPGKRERILLAYLALSPNGHQPRRKLASLLWGEGRGETALDSLRTTLWGVRKALGDGKRRYITSDGEQIAMDVAAFDVDVLHLRKHASHQAAVNPQDLVNLEAAEFLSGLRINSNNFDLWHRAEANRCRDQLGQVLTRLMLTMIEKHEIQHAIEIGTKILTLEPLHEDAARRLMTLYVQCGRRITAIQLYQTLAAALQEELETDPEPETRALYEAILNGTVVTPLSTIQHSSDIQPAQKQISVAVLPFANLSRDLDQEFFSDGISEEITAALTQVRGLRVVGRASVFQVKGERKNLRDIGRNLGASHVIEGSVRRAGNRVRITAQLICVLDGAHLWAENYDRELTDVFAIQEDIAQAIAASLQTPQGLKEGQTLVPNKTSDIDSYQDYLRARALVRIRGPLEPGGPLTEAVKLLEQVTARDRNYAPALGLLGEVYSLAPSFSAALVNGSVGNMRQFAVTSLRRAELIAQSATRADPNKPEGFTALAYAKNYQGQFVEAEDLFKRALSLDPDNPEALHQFGSMLAGLGRIKEALPMLLRLQAQEPLVPVFNRVTAELLWLNGQAEKAITTLKALPRSFGPCLRLAEVYASEGHFLEAADALHEIPPGIFSPETIAQAVRLLRLAPKKAPPPDGALSKTRLGFIHLYTGAPDCVLDYFDALSDAGCPALGNPLSRLWAASYAPVRSTKRFRSFVRKIGMLGYWHARGWPDFYRAGGVDGFEFN